MISVIILGATGVTGREVLGELLSKNEDIEKVTVLARRKATVVPESYGINLEEEEKSGRLQQHIVDFETLSLDNGKQYFEGHTAYVSCFGTTRRIAGSADNFKHIDYDYNLTAAQIAKEADIKHISLVSTQGANAGSMFLYLNSKGKLENAVSELKAPITSIFRPTFLNRGSDSTFMEKAVGVFMTKILPSAVAKAMVKDLIAEHQKEVSTEPRVLMYENADILQMTKE